MMDRDFEAKLIECLSALEQQEPLEAVLARYPEDAAALRPHLQTARALAQLRREPSRPAEARSRAGFLAAAAEMRAKPRRSLFSLQRFPALEALALLLLALGVGAILVAMSGSALPGSPLYGVKRTTESVRLIAAPGSEDEALLSQFEAERRAEVRGLLEAGREAQVQFQGMVETIEPTLWVVGGIPVHLDSRTVIEGPQQMGAQATVRGETIDGTLVADEISVAASPLPEVEPSETPDTSTPSPSSTPSPALTVTQAPVIVPTAMPSALPPAPTQAPAPTDDNEGDDGDNSGSDGEDGDDSDSGDD